jgi:LemA protein
MTPLLIIIGILVVLAVYGVSTYNNLIALQQKVKEGASDIDVQLKRRYDLVPNLIETVKGAAKFEQETMTKVIEARNSAMQVSGLGADKAIAENQLTGALRQLFALSENYPDLKASANYLELQKELTNTEDRILSARRFYNATVSDYNASQNQFPALLFKSLANAQLASFFELENPTEERSVPKVSF